MFLSIAYLWNRNSVYKQDLSQLLYEEIKIPWTQEFSLVLNLYLILISWKIYVKSESILSIIAI